MSIQPPLALLKEDLAEKGESFNHYCAYRILYMHYLIYSSHRGYETHIIFSMLHPRKGELREVRTLAQGHTPDKHRLQVDVLLISPFAFFVAHRKEHPGSWGLPREAPPCLAVAQGFRD